MEKLRKSVDWMCGKSSDAFGGGSGDRLLVRKFVRKKTLPSFPTGDTGLGDVALAGDVER